MTDRAEVETGAAPAPAAFDLLGQLPTGTTVLEASAGTGKTYAIAALVARYLADGAARLDQLLMVTFSRSATNELRSRIRERLVGVGRALAARRSGGQMPPDSVHALLCTGDAETLALRQRRIDAALADFDAATIATTHEFCQRMLAGLGVLGESEPGATFVEDLGDLVHEVTADVYLQTFAEDRHPRISYPQAKQLAKDVVGAPHAELVPAQTQGQAQLRYDFGHRLRAEVEARKRGRRLFTYDDMLTRLRDALADPSLGDAAARRLSDRYRIVLVDEFQDTDPIQWEIVRRAFDGSSTLVLIGDPKQAIYGFRGADVFSYLEAVSRAEHVSTLDTNYRSDADLLTGLDLLFSQAALGEGIQVRPVEASHARRRLTDDSDPEQVAPIRIRFLPDDPDAPRTRPVSALRPALTRDLVADVGALLASDAMLAMPVDARSGEPEPAPRPVRPSDIAVLVNTNATAERIRQALTDAGIPAVLTGASSVFAAAESGGAVCEDWATLLAALERPTLSGSRRVAMTRFVGWTFEQLATAGDDELTRLSQLVRTWARVLNRHGVAALMEDIGARTNLTGRLLAHLGGERELTDLRHIGQLLHAASVGGQLGLPGLVEWLTERRAEAVGGNDDRSRRLETDSTAVQILTIHRSKGLEFPIVYLPEAWDRHVADDEEDRVIDLHQPHLDGSDGLQSVLDVGGSAAPGRPERWAQYRKESDGESLRLLYVGLTRAQCQVVTWWQPSRNTRASPLQRLLFGPRRPGASPDPEYAETGDPTTLAHLDPRYICVQQQVRRTKVPPTREPTAPVDLRTGTFDRTLDLTWRRTSYTALTSAAHGVAPGPGVSSEAVAAKEDDERTGAEPADGSADNLPAIATDPPGDPTRPADPTGLSLDSLCPMGALPGGTEFGSLVHAIAEEIDPQTADLEGELHAVTNRQLARMPAVGFAANDLVAGLRQVYATPLGPLADDHDLAGFGAADRLAELDFELPLAGGDDASAAVWPTLADVAGLLRRHLPTDDPLVGYPDALADPMLASEPLRGYLTGSIDAVLRVRPAGPAADGTESTRYLVVDYKTNRLGPIGQPSVLGDYAPARLADAMIGAHYPLQALLYAVALHRYLRWRQPGYHPDVHLAGVLYLFVRGMAGPATPRVDAVPCGVFSWRPPSALVTELSDLLDRGAA